MVLIAYNWHGADIEQILLAAQRRWLLPAEICEILRNYKKVGITPELVNKPPSIVPPNFN
ncbi:hypothetical protein SLEP1_g24092 [Rubroshorea leprosula]|uniref:CG-1 domain-containing protein n=1 Tax=Rubroshorea leprosula TaxID=152421 RepID=A0AAV5JRL1_9ROSI|nr:hypothetical protein SLEP1_g24092 [Rubroshorea leprosula]